MNVSHSPECCQMFDAYQLNTWGESFGKLIGKMKSPEVKDLLITKQWNAIASRIRQENIKQENNEANFAWNYTLDDSIKSLRLIWLLRSDYINYAVLDGLTWPQTGQKSTKYLLNSQGFMSGKIISGDIFCIQSRMHEKKEKSRHQTFLMDWSETTLVWFWGQKPELQNILINMGISSKDNEWKQEVIPRDLFALMSHHAAKHWIPHWAADKQSKCLNHMFTFNPLQLSISGIPHRLQVSYVAEKAASMTKTTGIAICKD